MTKNQIEYLKVQEARRANRANENLTYDRDLASRQLGLDTLRETARHNQQVELNARDNLAEQHRHNVAQLAEQQRAHLASEGLTSQQMDVERTKAQETQRHNEVTEGETQRHNVQNEYLTGYSSDISRLAAELGASSRVSAAGISAAASQYASDQALLAKQMQSQIDKYGIDTSRGLRTAELSETRRANFARQAEINRANRADESIRSGSLLESFRHNLISEGLSRHQINADIDLRGQQNRIAARNAETQSRKVDVDVALAPSQKFSNIARGIGSLASPIVQSMKGS